MSRAAALWAQGLSAYDDADEGDDKTLKRLFNVLTDQKPKRDRNADDEDSMITMSALQQVLEDDDEDDINQILDNFITSDKEDKEKHKSFETKCSLVESGISGKESLRRLLKRLLEDDRTTGLASEIVLKLDEQTTANVRETLLNIDFRRKILSYDHNENPLSGPAFARDLELTKLYLGKEPLLEFQYGFKLLHTGFLPAHLIYLNNVFSHINVGANECYALLYNESLTPSDRALFRLGIMHAAIQWVNTEVANYRLC